MFVDFLGNITKQWLNDGKMCVFLYGFSLWISICLVLLPLPSMCCEGEVDPKKNIFFVIEKYVRDIIQGQKMARDLPQSIMKLTGHGKEELRRILLKMNLSRCRITDESQKSGFQLFRYQEKSRIPAGDGLQEQSRSFVTKFHYKSTLPDPKPKKIDKKTAFSLLGPILCFYTRDLYMEPPGFPVWAAKVWLPANSLIIMQGEARYAWQHGIPRLIYASLFVFWGSVGS